MIQQSREDGVSLWDKLLAEFNSELAILNREEIANINHKKRA